MTLGRVAVLVFIGLLVLIANVSISFLYMVVYGHLIDPGHEEAYYQAHIKIAAPYCSIIAGIPLMFLTGWWVGGFWGVRLGVQSAIIVWLAYAAIHLAAMAAYALAAPGLTARDGVLVAFSLLTQLAAAYLGGLVAGRSA
jgi:hypothetical protein